MRIENLLPGGTLAKIFFFVLFVWCLVNKLLKEENLYRFGSFVGLLNVIVVISLLE